MSDVKKITGAAVLIAIEIVLQTIGNYIALGPISINLSLIPIALGAIIYGPFVGALLGLINGVAVLFAPSTQAIFLAYAPLGTIITCLVKCSAAGLVSGFAYKLIEKKNAFVATLVASLLVPIINTGLFALFSFTLLIKAIEALNGGNANLFRFVFLALIGWNFIFEFSITLVLSTTLARIIKIKKEQ